MTRSSPVRKRSAKILSVLTVALLTSISRAGGQQAQVGEAPHQRNGQRVFSTLPLDEEKRGAVERAVNSRNYPQAEELLAKAIEHQPKSYVLLAFLGRVFFLDGKYLNCAIAMKKAEAVTPLKDPERYILALSYINLNHPDWARSEFEVLTRSNPGNPLSTYWLGRIDYDGKQYQAAAAKFQKALDLNPKFMKAYENLGLTYEALGQYDDAIKTYTRALELNRKQPVPSPWPPLDLGILLVKLGRFSEAEFSLRESLHYDARFPKAHCQLGLLLEKETKDREALRELRQATQYDPADPEPHYIMGQIYQRSGDKQQADVEWKTFQKLKANRSQERSQ